MRFWDSSAVLPLFINEAASGIVAALLREDGDVVVWWGTWIECSVAVNRLVRYEDLDEEVGSRVRTLLEELSDGWSEIQPGDELRSLAERVSRKYPLKAADALQLAAATVWCERDTEGSEFVCLDNRLRRAVEDEGFDVLPEGDTF